MTQPRSMQRLEKGEKMSRIMKVTCDWCNKDITNQEYQTITFRRYAGINHEKVYRLPTMWMCDKCYKKLALKMSFPPYEEGGEDGSI